MKLKSYALGLLGVHVIAYAAFLYVTYSIYEGGREFVSSDIFSWLFAIVLPVMASLIVWLIMLLLSREKAMRSFYGSIAVFSVIGAAINSFAAYLAWWSAT